jgi:S-DNA-T family DNA segregation ATPase FtsK/SpoIIIE
MPASKKRKPRARRPTPVAWPKLPVLEQRHLDLIGLALVAAGIFFAGLIYLDWDGGEGGSWAVDGLRSLIGAVHVVLPIGLFAAGALVVLRPLLPAVRPFRAGGLCLFLALALGFAAGTLGLGPGGSAVHWDAAWVRPRGGVFGEGLYWALSTVLGAVGAHIVALFLFLAAVLLLTGASIAGVVKATTTSVSTTTRDMRAAVSRRRATDELAAAEVGEPRVSRATPDDFWSGEDRYPDLYEEPTEVPDTSDSPPEPAPERDLDAPEPDSAPRLAEDPETDEPGVTRAAGNVAEGERDEGASRLAGETRLTPQGRYRPEVTDSPDFVWTVPGTDSLKRSSEEASRPDTTGQEKVAAQLVEALGHFGVEARVIGKVAGPHITRYELRLAPGIKVAKVAQLKDDLAYALAASDIRILAPIPGKQAVGVEVPNARRRIVHLGDVFQRPPSDWSPLTVWLGKDVAGRAIGADLAKMPHLLVAGTTGAGKSGCVNAMLSSVLLRATPHEVRMVLVDPKQVELTHYDSIPHLLTPVITSPRKAATALQNLVREMEQRYGLMSLSRTRTLKDLNEVRARRGEATLPHILCVIDELADLMMPSAFTWCSRPSPRAWTSSPA